MREFGFLWPIMVNGKTRRIVAGNGRYLAALRLGLPVVPMVEERHLTPLQRRAFIIIYMPDGTRYNHEQSPRHPCTSYLNLADGSVMNGAEFPVVG